MTDFRHRLTRQVTVRLAQARSVLVVGGPKMGKSYLVAQVQQAVSGVKVADDLTPSGVRGILDAGETVLMTAGVEHYHELRDLRDQVMWVPLTNLTPKTLRGAVGVTEADWDLSAGHPYLSSRSKGGEHAAEFASFRRSCGQILESRPVEKGILQTLSALPDHLRSHERYGELEAEKTRTLKRDLDW